MVPVQPESARVDSAGLWRTLAGLRGPVKIIALSSLQQIAQWLKNNHRKTLSMKVREADPKDPIMILIAHLTGSKLAKPRAPPPYNVWAKQPNIKALVDKEYKLSHPTGQTDCNLLRDIRSRLYNEMVPAMERLHWRKLAMDEGKVAVEEWEQNPVRPLATDPESCQQLVVHVLPLEYTPLTWFKLHWRYCRNHRAVPWSHLHSYWDGCLRTIWRSRASRQRATQYCQVSLDYFLSCLFKLTFQIVFIWEL